MHRKNAVTEASISLFEFLCLRLRDIGIRSIHGVPGDFSLTSLDYVQRCGLRWVGNCNELNAGYAADGYARIKGISALMTVMGVGELSALNAIAGSFAEMVPVIHIISMPSRQTQREKRCVHHSFGDGDFEVFKKMTAAASCMSVTLDCSEHAPAQINAVIQECWIQSRPVSIFVPSDLASVPVNAESLTQLSCLGAAPLNDMIAEGRLVHEIITELEAADNPILLLGGLGVAHDMRDEIMDLVHALKLPVLSASTGRGLIDEDHEQYVGLYVGDCSEPGVIEMMKSVDLVLSIGIMQSDLGTAGFSGKVERKSLIDIQRNRTTIKEQPPTAAFIQGVLQTLVARLDSSLNLGSLGNNSDTENDEKRGHFKQRFPDPKEKKKHAVCPLWKKITSIGKTIISPIRKSHPLRHNALWPSFESWLQDGDVILAEAGTASFGLWKTPFPRNATWIGQYLWASIGYTVGACQGAALALRDSGDRRRRTILFVGDASLQVCCQEISTMVRLGLKPIIFVVCNGGYTIERYVHGPDESYSDIQTWDYRYLPAVFGAGPDNYRFHRIRTMEQLDRLFSKESFKHPSVLQIVELHLPSHDAPSTLIAVAQTMKRQNDAGG